MQNKKMLSVCLSVLLVCLCAFGTLCLSANAATSVLFTVNGTDNASENQYVSLEAALNAASAKTDWLATDALTIEVSTSAVEVDVLGIDPILVEGNALPIIIKGGSLSFANDVFCKNDVTFEGTTIAFASDVDFVSAGNVALKGCTVTGAAEFFADGAAASSLTFENTNFGGTVYAAGAAESVSADATATVTVKGTSEVSAIAVRKDGAAGYARNVVLNVAGNAKTAVAGVGTAPAGTFNVELNISGGTVSSVNATGLGEANVVVNTITGGTVTDFAGTSGIAQSVTNNVSGGTVTNFYGSSSDLTVTGEIGSITNNFTGGKITNFYGSGNSTATATAYSVGSIVNNLTGGSFASDALYGTGHNAYAQNVTNNMNGTEGKAKSSTKFYSTFGIFNTASTPKLTGEGLNVKGTLTNNYVKASKFHTLYNVASAIDGDVVVNTGDPSASSRIAIERVTGSNAANFETMVVGGNFTFNAHNSGMNAEWTILSGTTVRGNVSIYANNISAASHFRLAAGKVDGNFSATIENSFFNKDADANRYLQGPAKDVGGSITWVLKNVEMKSFVPFEPIAADQDGDVSLTFENTSMTYAYGGVEYKIGGTFRQELIGKNPFKGNVFRSTTAEVGTMVNVIGDGLTFSGDVFLVGAKATHVYNQIGASTFESCTLRGTGSEAETVENHLNGTTISKSFIGSANAADKVKNYVNATIGSSFYGVYTTQKVESVYNEFSGGTITASFYGAYHNTSSIREIGSVENKISGGTIKGTIYGTAYHKADSVVNHFAGGQHTGAVYGTGEKSEVGTVINNYNGGTFCYSDDRPFFYALGKSSKTQYAENILDGDFKSDNAKHNANLYLSNGHCSTVVNHFYSAALTSNTYGNDGNFDTVTNHFYGSFYYDGGNLCGAAGASTALPVEGEQRLITNNFYPGATFDAGFYGADFKDDAKVAVAKVVNNVDGAIFNASFNASGFRGLALAVENNIKGNAKFANFAGGYSRGLKPPTTALTDLYEVSIVNNISGGTFEVFTGGNKEGHSDFSDDTIVNNISGGTFKDVVFSSRAGTFDNHTDGRSNGADVKVTTNITGGTFEQTFKFTAVAVDEVVNNIKGGTFADSVTGSNGTAKSVITYIEDGTFEKSYIAIGKHADSVEVYMSGGLISANLYGAYGGSAENIYIEISGGNIKGTMSGTRSDADNVEIVVTGGTIKEYRGTYSDAGVEVGKVTNRILGGTVTGNFWGNGEKSIVTEVVNEFTGGTIGDAAEDIANVCGPTVTKFSNNFDGTTFVSTLNATSYNSGTYNNMVFDAIVNDFKSGTYGSIYATGSGVKANSITNNIGEVTITGAFYGTGSGAQIPTVTNNVNGATFGKFYGTNSNCTTVYNNFKAATFGDFFGTNGASDTVYNTFDGEFTFNANTYLTNGTTKLIVNNFFSVNFTKNTYGCQGHFNKVVNNFHAGSKASAFRGAAGMGNTNTTKAADRMKDEYAYEIENNVYSGANLNTLYGVDGKYARFPQFRKVTNNIYDGAKLTKLYGGGQRGFVLDIVNNVYGSASITDTFYGGSSGSKVPDTEPGYATTITNNFGSETVPFTGTIKKFYGGQQTSAGILTCDVVNNVYSGTITTFYGGGAGGRATSVLNNIMGGKISTFLGGGSAAIGSVVNNFSPNSISTFYGGGYGTTTGFKIDYIENNIAEGLTFKYYNGGSLIEDGEAEDGSVIECFAEEGKIINNIKNITITGSYYGGGYGPADYIENNINGGVFAAFYGTRVGATEVVNNFTAGEFTTFNGTRGTCDKVTNTFNGEFTFKDNVYLTNGTCDQIVNEFISGNINEDLYGCQGHFNKVVNNFRSDFYVKAFRGAAGMGSTGTKKDADRMKDEYAYEVVNNVNGASFGNYWGVDGKQAAFPQFRKVTNNIYSGSEIKSYYGGGQRGVALNIVNNLFGSASITDTFNGGNGGSKIPETEPGYATTIVNNIGTAEEPFTGTIKRYNGGQMTSNGILTCDVTNNVFGGKITTYYGGGSGKATSIVNNIEGVKISTYLGAGSAAVGSVVNNFNPASISAYYGGGYGTTTGYKIDSIVNHIAEGLTFKYYNGGSLIEDERLVEEGSIINNIKNITVTESYYGSGFGPADYVENNINGGTFEAFYGTRTGVKEVVNNFTAGVFATFNGARGTCGKVTNTFDGEFTFKENTYLTNCNADLIVNNFHKVNFTQNTYGCQGHFNKVINNFYEGSVAKAFRGAAGMGNTGTKKDADRMKDEYAYEVENNIYKGANLAGLFGVDGKQAAFPQFRKVTNNIYSGAVIGSMYGGGQRGIALEVVNNIYGDATFTKALYAGSSGSKIPETDNIYDTKITTNIGTESEPFTGIIPTFRAGQSTVAGIKSNTVVTKIYGGTYTTFYGGSVAGDHFTESITTEIHGANLKTVNASGEATTDSASTVIADSSIAGTVTIKEGQELLLTGTINIYSATHITATKVEDVVLVQNEVWENRKEYLIVLGGTTVGEVTTTGTNDNAGHTYTDPSTGAIIGLSFPKSAVMASLSLQERIQIKIWLPKADVDTWIKTTNTAFEYQAVINVNGELISLGKGVITAPHAADISSLTSGGVRTDYYVVTFEGVGAANFDKQITISGSFFSVDTTVFTLVNSGIQLYKGTSSENLFKSIYDYGAVCTGKFTKYDELPCTSKAPASVVTPSSNAALSYDHVEALMEDAVGIRFVMNKGASFDPAQLVLKLDGVVMKKDIEYAVTVAGDKVYVDVYFKAKHMSTDFELVIEAGGARALYYASSVERTVSEISKANRRDQVLLALMAYILQVKAYNI